MKLYFAYGSNLNLKQMEKRCPDSKLITKDKIPNYQLNFAGPLTIINERHQQVIGAVFEISKKDEMALDHYEGWPHLYKKKTLTTKKGYTVMTYYISKNIEYRMPSNNYLLAVQQGYLDCNLNLKYLDQAVDRVEEPYILEFDDRKYYGTSLEIIKEMNRTTFFTRNDYREYMNDYAERYKLWFGVEMEYLSPINFISELIYKQRAKIISKRESE